MQRPISQSFTEGAMIHTEFGSPIFHTKSLPIELDESISSFISLLLTLCRPSAVFKRVWSVTVPPIKAEAFRLFPHIRKKITETFAPSGANFNAARTVPLKAFVLWIMTALDHRAPNFVFAGSVAAMLDARFYLITTTALGFTLSKKRSRYRAIGSAVAAAKPHCTRPFIWCARQHEQTTKAFARVIIKIWHTTSLTVSLYEHTGNVEVKT